MAARRSILGPALFNPDSAEHSIPDAWMRLFMRTHADAQVRLLVFQACRGSRDLVLASAPKARLRLDLTAAQSPEQVVSSAKQALAIRREAGAQGTTSLAVSSIYRLAAQAEVLLGLASLVWENSCIISEFRVVDAPRPHPRVELIAVTPWKFIPAALPHLTILAIKDTARAAANLPARKDLSHVTSLTTIAMFNDLTIAPLIPQLIELTAIRPQHMALGWPYLFTSTAPNLKRLTTNSNLTDELLSHVIDKLPGLEYLSVTTVELFNYIKTDTGVTEVSHKEQTWGVKQLVLGMSMTYSAERLAYLPSSREAGVRLTISGRVVAGEQQPFRLPIENAEGLSPSFLERMSEWHFDCRTIQFTPGLYLTPSHRHSALQSILAQLPTLPLAPHTRVHFHNWGKLTTPMARTLRFALPTLPGRRFGLDIHRPLTDDGLQTVLDMGTQMCDLQVGGLALGSDKHGDKPWPWDEVQVGEVDVAQLCKLPDPCGAVRRIKCERLVFTSEVFQVGVERVQERLRQIQWAHPSHESEASLPSLQLHLHRSTAQPDALPTYMSLLQSLSIATPRPMPKVSIQLVSFAMTQANMEALSSLPHWYGCIDFNKCTWPLKPADYTALAKCVPVSYGQWCIKHPSDAPLVRYVCAGLNARRAGLRLPRVELHLSRTTCKEEGEHVTLTKYIG